VTFGFLASSRGSAIADPADTCTSTVRLNIGISKNEGDKRVFVSYATPDEELAKALVDFIRLGCNLAEEQVFITARPGKLPKGSQFTEVIREALDGAAMAILLLTPSYYESRFCLAEAGSVWVQQKLHIPMLVPPVDYHDLEGVQLGEQAAKIDSSTDLDEMRDQIHEVTGKTVPTGSWNEQKERFLDRWAIEFDGKVSPPRSVPFEEHSRVLDRAEQAERDSMDLRSVNERLRDHARKLETQNESLRMSATDAPAAPVLEEDEHARYLKEIETSIELAATKMHELPSIAAEALFQFFHSGDPLTVGGPSDLFPIETARKFEEQGYLSLVEDQAQAVTPRREQPIVAVAESALEQVREIVFSGASFNSRARASDWAKPILKEKYGVDDPTFELRPVWEALGFL